MVTLTQTLLILALKASTVSSVGVEFEARIIASLVGVDPVLSVAVLRAESSGRVNALSRDKNDIGLYQINCPTWCNALRIDRKRLAGRHTNIVLGNLILAHYKAKYERSSGSLWVGHYNSGTRLTDRGKKYAVKVQKSTRPKRS